MNGTPAPAPTALSPAPTRRLAAVDPSTLPLFPSALETRAPLLFPLLPTSARAATFSSFRPCLSCVPLPPLTPMFWLLLALTLLFPGRVEGVSSATYKALVYAVPSEFLFKIMLVRFLVRYGGPHFLLAPETGCQLPCAANDTACRA